jgi:ApbE superfamily uncharacterized protein (UPF0280 family)
LPDGHRLHLSDGPIDLILRVWGDDIAGAEAAAVARAATILDELCNELPLLRAPATHDARLAMGPVASRMQAAVAPFMRATFITPMAAVAGAVADAVLAAMAATGIRRGFVNNGGDIALYLAPGERLTVGLIDRPDRPSLTARAILDHDGPVRGIATSGWRGRSHSRGIADAVTVLATSAAAADAAATVIANAVDLPGHPAVTRVPCRAIDPDSDLGDIAVTRAVGALTETDIAAALHRGERVARTVLADGLAHAVALNLAGVTRVIDTSPALERSVA